MVEVSGHREAQAIFDRLHRERQAYDEWISNYVKNRIAELLRALNDKLIEHNIVNPEDAYKRGLPKSRADALYKHCLKKQKSS